MGFARGADYKRIIGACDRTHLVRLEFPCEEIIPRLKAVVRKCGVTFVSVYEVGHGCQRRGTQPTVLYIVKERNVSERSREMVHAWINS